jgi:hypothetical protein
VTLLAARGIGDSPRVVRLASAVALPTGPSNAVTPAVFTVSAKAPSTVLAKLMSPADSDVSTVSAVSNTGSL